MKATPKKSIDFEIVGGKKLSGTIRTGYSKNGSVGLLCASLVNRGTTILHGIARIGEVYRIISGIMIKSSKDETIKELAEKKKILDMRINSMEKQEKILEEKSLRLREEVAKEFVRKAEKK